MAAAPLASHAQSSEFTLVNQQPANADNEPRPVFPVPTERQLKWNQTEFYAFFHYGMNTYTYKEWGDGSEDESIFAPTAAADPPCNRPSYPAAKTRAFLHLLLCLIHANGSKLSRLAVCAAV